MKKLKFLCVFFLAAVFFLSSCSTTRSASAKAGAAVGLPFAFVADSVLFPFQFLGHFSQGLLGKGEAVNYEYSEKWSFVWQNDDFGTIYTLPGYLLSPFIPLAQLKFFGLTDACVNTLTRKNIPYRRRRDYYY